MSSAKVMMMQHTNEWEGLDVELLFSNLDGKLVVITCFLFLVTNLFSWFDQNYMKICMFLISPSLK